jgi:hypothetical protein
MRATMGFEQDIMREGLIAHYGFSNHGTDLVFSLQHPISSRVYRVRATKASGEKSQCLPLPHFPSGNRIRSVPGRGATDERRGGSYEREHHGGHEEFL